MNNPSDWIPIAAIVIATIAGYAVVSFAIKKIKGRSKDTEDRSRERDDFKSQ